MGCHMLHIASIESTEYADIQMAYVWYLKNFVESVVPIAEQLTLLAYSLFNNGPIYKVGITTNHLSKITMVPNIMDATINNHAGNRYTMHIYIKVHTIHDLAASPDCVLQIYHMLNAIRDELSTAAVMLENQDVMMYIDSVVCDG